MIGTCVDMRATGRNINRLRIENGLSMVDIQNACGFGSPQAVYKWVYGMCMPKLDNLVILSELFRKPMDEIVIRKETGTCG